MTISPEQIRAARAILRLKQAELARRVQVSVSTIRRLEGANGGEQVTVETMTRVRQALESAGVNFIPDGVLQRRKVRAGAVASYEDLRAISLRAGARLQCDGLPSDIDLYDEEGLPA